MTLRSLLNARSPVAASPGVPATATPGVTINTWQVAQNVFGARLKTWVPKYSNVPARIVDATSDNAAYFMRNGLQISHVVIVGNPGGGAVTLQITNGEQVQWGQRVFEIQGAQAPRGRTHAIPFLILGCLEKTPGLAAAAFPQP